MIHDLPWWLRGVKHLPAVQENRVRFLGWEDPMEKEMATHSSILAWRIPWTEESGGPQSLGSPSQAQPSDQHFHLFCMSWVISQANVQSLSRVRLCRPMDCSTAGLPVHHQLPELAQTQVHRAGDAIQASHPLSSPSPPAFNHCDH